VEFSRDFFAGETEQNNNNNKYCSTATRRDRKVLSRNVRFVMRGGGGIGRGDPRCDDEFVENNGLQKEPKY